MCKMQGDPKQKGMKGGHGGERELFFQKEAEGISAEEEKRGETAG